jgi:preprotein translocase subunit SecG
MADDDGGAAGVASNLIWALAFFFIVGIIVLVLYKSGVLSSKPAKHEIDINVSAPN